MVAIDVEIAPGRSRRQQCETVPIAPLCGWMGQVAPRPAEYGVSICMAHLNTLEQLRLAIDLWRCQTIKPYIMVIDTGSPAETLADLEALRAPDVELHFIRAHGYLHSSAPVSAALDLAHSLCRTPYLFHTHTDVFPRRRNFLEWLRGQCNEQQPVIGWRMTNREMSWSPSKHEWRECVSHTATMIHMPTSHKCGLTWAMEAFYAHRPQERGASMGWPDTESPFHLAMRRAGLKPKLIGDEHNFELTRNDWYDHARSFPGLKLMGQSNPLWVKAQEYMARAEADARQRLEQWRAGKS